MQIKITQKETRSARLRASRLEFTKRNAAMFDHSAVFTFDPDNDVRIEINQSDWWTPHDLRDLADCLNTLADKVETGK